MATEQSLSCHAGLILVAIVGSGVDDQNSEPLLREVSPIAVITMVLSGLRVPWMGDNSRKRAGPCWQEKKSAEAADIGVFEDKLVFLDIVRACNWSGLIFQRPRVESLEEMADVHGLDEPISEFAGARFALEDGTVLPRDGVESLLELVFAPSMFPRLFLLNVVEVVVDTPLHRSAILIEDELVLSDDIERGRRGFLCARSEPPNRVGRLLPVFDLRFRQAPGE